MATDSLTLVSAALLCVAAVGAWIIAAPLKARARLYLRFAGMLLAALAASSAVGLADTAVLLLLPLSATALMLSALARFAKPLNDFIASTVLVAALAGGLGALLSGNAILALVPAALASLAVIVAALRAIALSAGLSGAALLASCLACLQSGAGAGVLLFCAAALVGLAKSNSALAVDQQSDAWRGGTRAVGPLSTDMRART
ncbi:MAG TPA: hypothetical protein VGM26_05915 [Rhizomicrobium sp.]|jgi:hypothetical protein